MTGVCPASSLGSRRPTVANMTIGGCAAAAVSPLLTPMPLPAAAAVPRTTMQTRASSGSVPRPWSLQNSSRSFPLVMRAVRWLGGSWISIMTHGFGFCATPSTATTVYTLRCCVCCCCCCCAGNPWLCRCPADGRPIVRFRLAMASRRGPIISSRSNRNWRSRRRASGALPRCDSGSSRCGRKGVRRHRACHSWAEGRETSWSGGCRCGRRFIQALL